MIYQNKYIPLFVIVFLLLHLNLIEAQTIKEVKDQDTVFVVFKPGKKFKKFKLYKELIFEECTIYSYYYRKDEFVSFRCCYHLDIDRNISHSSVKRRWLKKQLIITEDFFKNNNFEDAAIALSDKKIFIIEAKDYKKRKVLIKQARFSSFFMEGTDDLEIEYEKIKN